MADSILRLRVDSAEYDNKLKQATNGLTRYVDECRKVGGTLEVVQKETLDYVRALGQMDTTSRTATGKLAEMKKAFTELSAQYKQMTDAEKQSPFGKALAASLDQLKGRIQDSKSQLDDINKSINGGGGLTGTLDNMLGKVGLNVEGLMKFGGAAGAATTALKVAKDAFFASETSLDEWGRTVQSSQSLYQGFLSALNNSDIGGFLRRMDEIVSAARDAYNAMDELGTFSAFQQRNVAKGRAGYAQALDEYRLNPTADNKQKLQQANLKVMNDLRESHDKTEAAYQAALRQIATERISGKGMQDAFVKMFSEGNYGDLQEAKSSYKTGRGLNSGAQYYYGDRVYDGRVQDRTTGKWRDMSATEKQQFEFARALSQVNDSQIKDVQALGAQSVAITEQIYQQDRAYNRLAGNNAPLRGGSGRSGGGGRSAGSGKGGKTITEEKDDFVEINGLINMAAERVSDLQKRIREAPTESMITELRDQLKDAQAELDRLNGKEVKIQMETGTSITNDAGISGYIASIKQQLETADYGTSLYNGLSAQLADMTTLQNLVGESLRLGLGTAMFDAADELGMDFWTRAMEGGVENIDWKAIVDKINEARKKAGLDAISLDFKTGEVTSQAKEMTKDWNSAASAIQSVGSAMSQIEDPAAKVMGTVAQAIATIALTFSKSLEKTFTPWDWIAAAAAGTATMISTISAIHSATGYAEGGMIKGNSFSGDNLRMPVVGGGMIGVNSGELILNRVQQGVLADALSEPPSSIQGGNPYVSGENIYLGINNYLRRSGRGEIVTTKR